MRRIIAAGKVERCKCMDSYGEQCGMFKAYARDRKCGGWWHGGGYTFAHAISAAIRTECYNNGAFGAVSQ